MANIDVEAGEFNVRVMRDGELEIHVSRTKQMLVASIVASMSIVAIAALFMSLWN